MQPPMPPTPESARIAAPAGEAVAQILACADIAVSSIERQAEQRVREIRAGAEVSPEAEALQRQARLETVRTDLTDRAAALADAYRAIHEELEAVDRMLAAIAHGTAYEAPGPQATADPRVAAIKMTLRERQRIHIGTEATPAAPAAAQPAPWHYEVPEPEPRYLEPPAQYREPAPQYEEPAPHYEAPVAPRRTWLPWQRAA